VVLIFKPPVAQNFAELESKMSKQETIPGSHDAGRGVFHRRNAFTTAANTQTQRLELSGLLGHFFLRRIDQAT